MAIITVDDEFQLFLPKDMCETLGLKPRDTVDVSHEGDLIKIMPVQKRRYS